MTVFQIYDLDVIFPYQSMYPEQKEFMGQLKLSFDSNGPCILEFPSGCGKNITIFSLVLAYLSTHPNMGPLVYAVSSIASFERAIRDIKIVHESRIRVSESQFDQNFRVVPFLSRELSCLDQNLVGKPNLSLNCAKATFPWNQTETRCHYYDNTPESLPPGVPSIEDFKSFAANCRSCPYHTARRLCQQAQVIICSTEEVVNPRGGAYLRKILPSNCIIVFDDANNIDDICCASMSFNITKQCIDAANDALKLAKKVLSRSKEHEQNLLRESYQKLKEGLHISDVEDIVSDSIDMFKHPVVDEQRSKRVIPGSLRNPDVLLGRLYNFIQYLNMIFTGEEESITTSTRMLSDINETTYLEPETLHFFATRFTYHLYSMNILEIDSYAPLYTVMDFAAVLSTYEENISVFYDTVNPNNLKLKDDKFKTLQVACFDASLAFAQILPFKRIVLTGEAISPLNLYSQILNFDPTSMVGYTITSSRNNILPIIVARGTDQTLLTSSIELSKNLNAINNYGRLITDICKVIPDGVIGFFPSYPFMFEIIEMWNQTGVLKSILDYKLIFMETQNKEESSLMIDNYKRAIDNGRGSLFFGVSTGLSSEGIDFSGAYGKCCILFGLPEPQKNNVIIKSRAEFLDQKFHISKEIFQIFNSVRIASRCFSKVLSSKKDYSLVLLADPRYEKDDYMSVLPDWIKKRITQNQLNQSVDDSVDQAKGFYLKMTQPFKHNKESIVLNGFQAWCQMHEYTFTQHELAEFIRLLKTKDEMKRAKITEEDYANLHSMKKWINTNWNMLEHLLSKNYSEWNSLKQKEKEI